MSLPFKLWPILMKILINLSPNLSVCTTLTAFAARWQVSTHPPIRINDIAEGHGMPKVEKKKENNEQNTINTVYITDRAVDRPTKRPQTVQHAVCYHCDTI